MNELALFAGAGGGLLGSRLLGWRTVCYVEKNPYCQKVIKARIKDGYLDDAPIWDDVTTFDGRPWAGCVDVISAGFPCQPFSGAGKQLGEHDKRNLWPDTIRIVREIKPEWLLLENVPRLLCFNYFGRILGDLAKSGFDARWDCIPASAMGAPHQRDRLWIIAHAMRGGWKSGRHAKGNLPDQKRQPTWNEQDGDRWLDRTWAMGTIIPNANNERCAAEIQHKRWRKAKTEPASDGEVQSMANPDSNQQQLHQPSQQGEIRLGADIRGSSQDVAYSNRERLEKHTQLDSEPQEITADRRTSRGYVDRCSDQISDASSQRLEKQGDSESRFLFTAISWWEVEPSLGRVVDGLANRVGQLEALGQGQVPAVVRAAWMLLSDGI